MISSRTQFRSRSIVPISPRFKPAMMLEKKIGQQALTAPHTVEGAEENRFAIGFEFFAR